MVQGKSEGIKGTANDLNDHLKDLLNPHQVTKAQVGLGNVNNVPRRITLQVFHTTAQGQNLTRYHTHFGMVTLEVQAQYEMPACTLTKFSFYVTTNSFFGALSSTRVAVKINNIATAMVVDIPGNTTGRIEVAGSEPVAEGDLLSIEVVTPNVAGNIIFAPSGMILGE